MRSFDEGAFPKGALRRARSKHQKYRSFEEKAGCIPYQQGTCFVRNRSKQGMLHARIENPKNPWIWHKVLSHQEHGGHSLFI